MLSDQQIKHMVDRFLAWRLPVNFNPDCGISFDKKLFNTHTVHPSRYEPVGTNLFDAAQADAMVRYLIEGMQSPPDRAFDNVFKLLNIAAGAETVEDAKTFAIEAADELRRVKHDYSI